jgi:hypothetical protein
MADQAADYFRLRQICLVAPKLKPVVDDIAAILELEVCWRDPAVAKYGLENALFPIGTKFLEVVAPTRKNTAAGRFLDRSGGRGGYMVIFDCGDVERRRRHAEQLGIRIANVIEYPDYLGVQLHPRDSGAAMIEFNHTPGGEDIFGPYHPAGPDWSKAVRTTQTKALVEIELESAEPQRLAAQWAKIIEAPVSRTPEGDPRIVLQGAAIRVVTVPEGRPDCLGALRIAVADVARAKATAAARGCKVDGDAFHLGGVHFRLQPA